MDSEVLRQEISRLKTEKTAFQAQQKLFENFVAMARSSGKGGMLKATLKKTLEISTELTNAEKSSLFLLDSKGVVVDSILTRSDTTAEKRSQLIGTVLDKGLAGWVRNTNRIGLITDTLEDDRWVTLPDQPYHVRSVLSVPILRGGELMGILTLLHSQPGHFNSQLATLMQVVADQIGLALENIRLYAKLDDSYRAMDKAKQSAEAYSKALDDQLEKGRQIQKDFLPQQIPKIENWNISAGFNPANQVSGDFYDVFMLPGNHIGLVVADVCDKGVGAALFMALFRSLIRIFSGQTHLVGLSLAGSDVKGWDDLLDPQLQSDKNQTSALKAIGLTNNYIEKNHGQMGMFATVFFGSLNPDTGLLTYINAGHEPLFVLGRTGVKARLKPTGPAVGLMLDAGFDIGRVKLEPGDIMIGYTDGVTEACSPNGAFFTKERLLSIVDQPVASASELLDRIKSNLIDFTAGTPQSDDITILSIQRLS